MPNIPFDLILDQLLDILLPGALVSFLAGYLLARWPLAGLSVLAGFLAANVSGNALFWFEWDRELGRIVVILFLSLLAIALPYHRRLPIGMAWTGILSATLFFHDDIPRIHLLAGAATSIVIYFCLIEAEGKLSAWNPPVLLSITGFATAIVMIYAHTARVSDIGLMWLAAVGGWLPVALLTKTQPRGLAELASVLFPFLLYYGKQSTDSQVPIWSFILLATAPLSCLLLLFKLNAKRHWLITLLWGILSLLAIMLAMWFEKIEPM